MHPHFFSVQPGQNLVEVQYSSADGITAVALGAARFVCVPRQMIDVLAYVNTDVLGALVDSSSGGGGDSSGTAAATAASGLPLAPTQQLEQPKQQPAQVVVVNWSSASVFVPSGPESREGMVLDIAHVGCEYTTVTDGVPSIAFSGLQTSLSWIHGSGRPSGVEPTVSEVDFMSVQEMKVLIESVGLHHYDCVEKKELSKRALDAIALRQGITCPSSMGSDTWGLEIDEYEKECLVEPVDWSAHTDMNSGAELGTTTSTTHVSFDCSELQMVLKPGDLLREYMN
jgi:hypothetical protein